MLLLTLRPKILANSEGQTLLLTLGPDAPTDVKNHMLLLTLDTQHYQLFIIKEWIPFFDLDIANYP